MKKIMILLLLFLFALTAISCGGASGESSDEAATESINDKTNSTVTDDTTAPTITSVSPSSGSINIAINTKISVLFSEDIDTESITADCICITGGKASVTGTIGINSDNDGFTYTPSADLEYSTNYTVSISGNICDTAANQIGTEKTFSFTTAEAPDTTAPEMSSTDPILPANNATDVSQSGNIIITFNEAMDPSTINNTNITLMFGTPASAVSITVTYNASSKQATIDPVNDLIEYTDYTITISTNVTDLAGNALASEYSSTFKTIADSTTPTVTNTSPINSATNVAAAGNIVITFSETIDPATTTSTNFILEKVGGSAIPSSVSINASHTEITIDPDSDLEVGPTEYKVTVNTGVKDASSAANNMASVYTFTFETTDGTGPTPGTISPANASSDNSVKPAIKIPFNEAIDQSTINSSTITVKDSSDKQISGTYGYLPGTMTATFTPGYSLHYDETYTVTVTTGVKDTSGNNLTAGSSSTFDTKGRDWTILMYMDADCDLERSLLSDIAEMKTGYVDDQGLEVIVLVDRHPSTSSDDGYTGDSTILGVNFSDTRLYRISNNHAEPIDGAAQFPNITASSGNEENMGDAATLKRFIQFGKTNYTATNYALILSNHGGGGVRGHETNLPFENQIVNTEKDICWDETDGDDCLYTGEISDTLTNAESVELFGLDACLMASVEFAYEFRTGNGGFDADIMVASAATEWGAGWDYENIFNRLDTQGGDNGQYDSTLTGNERYYSPASLTAQQLGTVIVEEQRDSVKYYNFNNGSNPDIDDQTLACIDLSKVEAVKTAADALGVSIINETENNSKTYVTTFKSTLLSSSDYYPLQYFDNTDTSDMVYNSYFDVEDLASELCNQIALNPTHNLAEALQVAADAMVLYSYAGYDYSGFTDGVNGVQIFCSLPYAFDLNGDGYGTDTDGYETPCWAFQWWYNSNPITESPINTSDFGSSGGYGKLDWCSATANNGTVENWFEFQDKIYDDASIDSGAGYNGYKP